ncbi:unnamed protein product [Mytilus edulis]|uniref:OTU domain-containing protein n=1 Tax=Mytilus edulis TaxID=6550 RepID=A0A8S3SVB6_MYTED|nr:unnamed protein product [Mytilus edulis]
MSYLRAIILYMSVYKKEFHTSITKNMLQAVVGQPHRITRNVTKSEALLLQTYSIEVPTANETQIEHTADRVSSSILAKFHPAILSEFYPAETYGDGNCLYRAVSRAITGSESMYIVLRVLTLIEILSYPMFYDPNHTRFTDLIQDNRIVVATYLQLAKDVGMLGTYADMMHMFALSAVLKIPIRSYFPPQMNMEFVSEPYSRKVCGRNVNISEAPACTIMWTSAVIPTGHTLITNHFVPLFKRKRTETLETVYTIDEDDHDNVNPVIVDSECSTTGDCPQMDISDTDEIDESCPLISNEDDTKVHPLSNGCLLKGFMDVAELFRQLSSFTYEEAYNNIPGGIKNNVFFALKNSDNIERRKRGAISNFSDDCGVYDGPKGSTSKTYYVTDPNGVAKFVQKRKDTFGVIKTEKGKKNFIPLENQPAPDEVVELIRNYSTSTKDSSYKRRVSWIGGDTNPIAIVEYIGIFPGLSAHGNTKKDTEYLRTPATVMTEMSDLLQKETPLNVYNKLTLKHDELSGPTSRRQVHDKKYRDKKNQRKNDCGQYMSRGNIADHINEIDKKLSEQDSIVKSIIRDHGKAPCLIMNTEQQLEDIKTLCCSGQSIVGIDKTFNLCDMHVTALCFKQTAVNMESTSEHPGIYPKQNAKQKLIDDAVNKKDRDVILDSIFGNSGPLTADDVICFEAKSDEISKKTMESTNTFNRYFENRLKNNIQQLWETDLPEGHFDKPWTNNNSESLLTLKGRSIVSTEAIKHIRTFSDQLSAQGSTDWLVHTNILPFPKLFGLTKQARSANDCSTDLGVAEVVLYVNKLDNASLYIPDVNFDGLKLESFIFIHSNDDHLYRDSRRKLLIYNSS